MAELNVAAACPPSLVVTPHPVTLEGQQRIAAELLPRETLGHFLARTVPDYGSDAWEVRINGVRVPHQIMDKVRPKGGTVIEVRGTVGRTALLIVAMVALTIFTAGVGTAMVAAGYSAMAAGLAQAAIYAVGSLLINKVLGPKKPKQYESDAATVFTIGSARNQARPHEPLPLVLGNIRMAPDIASQPYSFYEANDQFMALVLTPGINVGRVEAMFNGEALLSTYEGVQVWHSGFPGMPEEKIPLYSNVDTLAGGALEAEKGKPSAWVQRTSSASTIRLQLDFDYMLFDTTSKGKPKDNQETIQVQFRTVGATDWRVFGNFALVSQSQKQQRRTYALDVEPGQYEVRARIAGRNTDGKGATSDFTWSTLKSIQTDTASYAGIPRIGVRIKATGQLNGSPDELRCVAYALPIPVWKGNQWVTEESSNPGAQILAYSRGIRDAAGNLIAGLGLLDAQIDIAALQAFMLHCAASKYTYDNVIRDTRSHEDVLQAIALAGFGNVTWAAGRLSVVWAADEQPLSGVVNMATIKKGQFQIDYTLANAADGIEFTYIDRSDWSSKTLRVAAPGVQTMLNPAQVSGEGITSEDHAAKMARYHLAQSLYQYKDISFSTDIEHLSYRRLSVLALQHDLTQWGFGGRLVAAIRDGSSVLLQLDDVVRAPANGNSFIGLRIPGERVYRVFRVEPFAGEADQIRLADVWPADAPLPGDTDENPAHDTIWIFDFKQTPGYRVRVVGIEPESDLKGASVSVVPEGPEFWHYVETGEYIRAPNGSLLQTRPVASDLKITERQVVQGDTEFTELQATYSVTGPVGDVIVLSDLDGNDELEEVARTVTRTASWRIPGAGTYSVTVRPYSPEGAAGIAASVIYTTRGADAPPVLVDLFDVEQLSGGVRRYTWGFFSDTIQSANFAGVEIRYAAGAVDAPNWTTMTPLGDDGYHPSAFEAVLPEAGQWTFAIRSRNTAGTLSTGMLILVKELQANLGEVIGGLDGRIDETYEQALAANNRITQEILDRVAEDLRVAGEAVAAARAYTDAQVAALNGILEDIVGADEWAADGEYPAGDFVRRAGVLYRALADNTGVAPGTDPAVWQEIGEYTSVGDALAAAISLSTQNATDLQAEAARLDALLVRMPAGNGALATAASVAEQIQLVANNVEAIARRTSALESKLPDLATNAYVRQLDEAQTNVSMALGRRIDQTNAALAGKAEAGTVQQIQSKVEDLGGKVNASAQAITQVRAQANGSNNLLINTQWWAGLGTVRQRQNPGGQNAFISLNVSPTYTLRNENTLSIFENGRGSGTAFPFTEWELGESVEVVQGQRVEASVYGVGHRCRFQLKLVIQNYLGQDLAIYPSEWVNPTGQAGSELWNYQRVGAFGVVPAGGVRALCVVVKENTAAGNSNSYLFTVRPYLGQATATQTQLSNWTAGATDKGFASATQILETRATQLENGQTRLEAKAGVLLDVNGRVIGWRANNDGAQGIFDIVADRLNVTDPNGTGSTTFQQGRWITRSGGFMSVHGKPFGQTGDLMMYIGVGSDPNTASKANGLFWIDNKGNAYFGGSLSAGVLRNAVQTGTTQTVGTELLNGPFRTNGGNRTVTLSFARTHRRQRSQQGSTGFVAGAGANTAQVQLFRQIGTGGWVLWQTLNVTGSVSISNETDGPDIADSGWGGSFTVNDSSTAQEAVSYLARIVAFGEQNVSHQAGNFDTQTITQNLSIISVEQ
ncbi:host specificity factor TipJ family phage tail protein [Stenotrophomonas sp. NPDC077659]|uniref:host specificity factor TipJ family phage tail protein n=1 Tax=Stenotrophomonas sp. NPDC077659 TaxID=3390694 RepID=UPI003D0748E3